MKFVITGASKETGEDVELTVAAADRRQAETMAQAKGILVSAIKEVLAEHDNSPIALEEDAPVAAAPSEGTIDPAVKAALAARAAMAAREALAEPAPTAAHGAGSGESHGEVHAEDHRIHHTGHGQYKVLINPNLMLLVISVNTALKEGWELQGGVATCVINNANNYLQALVHWPEGG